MNLIFLGPPGAGKGTMASRLAQDKGIPHISTGDIFRENINNGTDLGKKVKSILDSGDLVPDELTVELVKDRLNQGDVSNGFILDGFPRTIPQAEALEDFASIDAVILFTLPDEEIVKRLSGRRVHKPSGRTYHILFSPPKVPGKDDVTGEELIQRGDDSEESIRNRLDVYRKQTQPLVDFYRKKNLLKEVDAGPAPDEVYEKLTANLP
ncbi:MAG: adenylate kinase [Spirochaetes bacterium]|jgi:adenylate kinase|nr:adenylate kinase [Spirochaetota bacterium]